MSDQHSPSSDQEVKRLRRAQAKTVMPLIGPLLDAFELRARLSAEAAAMSESKPWTDQDLRLIGKEFN